MTLKKPYSFAMVALRAVIALPLCLIGSFSFAQSLPGVASVQKVHGGFQFTEGPAFDGNGYLYFTDIPNDRILRTDTKGTLEVFMEKAGHCNGLMVDGNGKLIACRMDGEVVSFDTKTKAATTLSNKYNQQRFNACNDLVIDEQGGIYFTDPRYLAPEPWPQVKEAFYYRAPNGDVTRLGDDILAPNGIILSPDEKTLYIVPSMQKEVFAYDVKAPGKLENKRVFYQIKQPENKSDSGGDGLTVDQQGTLYITTDLGVQVVDERGELKGIIEFPEQPANCAFGGRDMKTLYATCRTGLYSVVLPVAGHVFKGKVK